MPTDWIIWGSKGHGMVVADAIQLNGGRVAALVDNDPAAMPCVAGAVVCRGETGLREWLNAQNRRAELSGAIAIGGTRGENRVEIGTLLRAMGVRLTPVIHPTAAVSATAAVSEGCHVLANAVVAAGAALGPMTIINNGAVVDHECELAEGVHVAPGAVLCGCISVGQHSMIGAGATVLPRLSIGRRCIIGAGATVTRNVPDKAVVVGSPAKEFRRA